MAKPELTLVEGLPLLRAELSAHGFEAASIARRYGLDPWRLPYELLFLEEEPATDAEEPFALHLVRLFVLGLPIPRWRFEQELSARAREAALSSGLVRPDGEEVASPFVLLPWTDFLLTCDREYGGWDTVNVPNDSSLGVAERVAPSAGEPSEVAVDLGTGCGVVALQASRFYRRVFAVDANPRAVGFARFNASLNGVAMECRVGEEIGAPGVRVALPEEPVDLITFVMPLLYPELCPGVLEVLFASSSHGDGIARALYAALPRLLAPRGRAVLWHQVIAREVEAWFGELGRALSIEAWRFRVDPRLPYYFVRSVVTRGRGVELRAGDEGAPSPGTRDAVNPVTLPAEVVAYALSQLDLSEREKAVLRHVASGYSFKTIARRQQIPAKTAETQLASVLRKLAAKPGVDPL